LRDAQGWRETKRFAQRRDYRYSKGNGTMPTMRMPWSKSANLQLDLPDTPGTPEAAPAQPAAPGPFARKASIVPTASLYEDSNNPHTEIPDAELDELADDIRQQASCSPSSFTPPMLRGDIRFTSAPRLATSRVVCGSDDGPPCIWRHRAAAVAPAPTLTPNVHH
jgi:hypothetical protein